MPSVPPTSRACAACRTSRRSWSAVRSSKRSSPVLPALTYTCHTSILTGTYAGRHGIVHNEKMTRGGHLDAPWYCMKSDVRGKTLLDIARENGLTTCSLSWPVSGGADYTMNMPMIVPYSYQGYQPQQWLEHTATANLMDRYFYKHGRYLMGPTRSLDLFTMALALDILEDGPQPDIMLVKLCDLDSARHTLRCGKRGGRDAAAHAR